RRAQSDFSIDGYWQRWESCLVGSACCLHCAHQAENENHKHDQARPGVEPVSLECKTRDCEGHARDGRCNQKQKTELNQTLAIEMGGRLEYSTKRLPDGAVRRELVI